MQDFAQRILRLVARADYRPLTLKQFAEYLKVDETSYSALRSDVRALVRAGQLEVARDKTLHAPGKRGADAIVGIFKRNPRGFGFVRPLQSIGRAQDIYIAANDAQDASTGDEVAVKLRPGARRDERRAGRVLRVLSRAAGQFVGTYSESGGRAFVLADGTAFRDPISVGDPGAKRARPGDKVAFELLRYPTADRGGEGVITEVLGPRGQPGVDTLMVVRAFNIPDEFDPSVLEDARLLAERFDEADVSHRLDLRETLTVTIDPATARDFDDAISLSRDDKGFWNLGVHIADVSHFVKSGSRIDKAARERGTSVYLPDRVIPMLPEVLSNGLASLQEGRTRYTMSALLQFDDQGRRTHAEFARTAIRVDKRFTYEQAYEVMQNPERAVAGVTDEVRGLVAEMLRLALILRKRRMAHGALELVMPDVEVDLDDQGRVVGAHLAPDDESHQVIEEFMLAANEAVAEHLDSRGVAFLRRAHPEPDAHKLERFAEFVHSLGFEMETAQSRFELQRVLAWSDDRPERHAVHFGLLRSLKQATYTIEAEGHYALASEKYCHFTSPIRRYPDLQVHRQLGALLAHKTPKSDLDDLALLAEHCTRTERRAESAERDLIRIKLLTYLEDKVGTEFDAVIIGVEDFGLFCQLVPIPVEGLVHVTSLADDYYYLEEETHTLIGRRSGARFRLGDRLRLRVARVNIDRRELDLVPLTFAEDRTPQTAPRGRRGASHGNPRAARGSKPKTGHPGSKKRPGKAKRKKRR